MTTVEAIREIEAIRDEDFVERVLEHQRDQGGLWWVFERRYQQVLDRLVADGRVELRWDNAARLTDKAPDPGPALPAEDQADTTREARAELLTELGAALALHPVDDGIHPDGRRLSRPQLRVHVECCPDLPHGDTLNAGTSDLGDVVKAAREGRLYWHRLGDRKIPAAWCRTCLTPDRVDPVTTHS